MTIALPHRGWLFDLDGTVYLGEAVIPGGRGF
jgi:ribonucleotide monophosphatase NagD (HAD superfamily)